MFTIQNTVEFELWQLDRVGGGIQADVGSRGKSAGTCVVLVCRMTLAYLASYLVVNSEMTPKALHPFTIGPFLLIVGLSCLEDRTACL